MKKSNLGQFYTPENISDLIARLTSRLAASAPNKIVDIACGNGSLLEPIQKAWPLSEVHAFDIDKENINQIKRDHPSWKSVCIDSLKHDFHKNHYDMAVGNPPYIKTIATDELIDLIHRNYDSNPIIRGSTIRAETAFVAKYLESTKNGGIISLILPKSVISSEKLGFMRKALLNKMKEMSVYEISSNYFDGAEVTTYIITGIKSDTVDKHVTIGRIGINGDITDTIIMDKKECLLRMDYNYLQHIGAFKQLQKKYLTIGEITHTITRGIKTKLELEQEGDVYFHTSSFKEMKNEKIALNGSIQLKTKYNPVHIAQKYDILIPRVGRKCWSQQALVKRGNAVLTDSVLRIEAPGKHSKVIFESLSSDLGMLWREVHAKGSCTKLLTLNDIFRMPIIGKPRP
ncbi:N-6 DNA methylase [Thiomicrorhabdus cannonii]|uniref:N-6 DNA methylase n=1 Tax=Thiomicrorhabdus cannonii TaxID=2748011 RepID=UPI0015C0F5CD|nr:N-6 DNA methylase [Thiomicrorhabdus cannonii]